jgi:hypothetical protein
MISSDQPQHETTTMTLSPSPISPTIQHQLLDSDNGNDDLTSQAQQVFDLMGVLEQVLSFLDTTDVVIATLVNHRWKRAGRHDDIWKTIIRQSWRDKKGMNIDTNMIFWRSLFTRDTVRAMETENVLCMFRHPLLQTQYETLQDHVSKIDSGQGSPEFFHRFVQLHMINVMFDGGGGGNGSNSSYHNRTNSANGDVDIQRRIFFSDLYFGSYASSILDSKRNILSQKELCTPFGFEMHFKVEREDAGDVVMTTNEELERYDDAEGILLYRYSTCHFRSDRDFRLVLRPNIAPMYRPTDLRWRWLEVGRRIQVGPYPSLTVSRTKDWGWKLENLHVVMYSNHGSWPPPQSPFSDDDDGDSDDSWSCDTSDDSSALFDGEDTIFNVF